MSNYRRYVQRTSTPASLGPVITVPQQVSNLVLPDGTKRVVWTLEKCMWLLWIVVLVSSFALVSVLPMMDVDGLVRFHERHTNDTSGDHLDLFNYSRLLLTCVYNEVKPQRPYDSSMLWSSSLYQDAATAKASDDAMAALYKSKDEMTAYCEKRLNPRCIKGSWCVELLTEDATEGNKYNEDQAPLNAAAMAHAVWLINASMLGAVVMFALVIWREFARDGRLYVYMLGPVVVYKEAVFACSLAVWKQVWSLEWIMNYTNLVTLWEKSDTIWKVVVICVCIVLALVLALLLVVRRLRKGFEIVFDRLLPTMPNVMLILLPAMLGAYQHSRVGIPDLKSSPITETINFFLIRSAGDNAVVAYVSGALWESVSSEQYNVLRFMILGVTGAAYGWSTFAGYTLLHVVMTGVGYYYSDGIHYSNTILGSVFMPAWGDVLRLGGWMLVTHIMLVLFKASTSKKTGHAKED